MIVNNSLISRQSLDEYHQSYEITEKMYHKPDIENRYALYRLHRIFKKYLPVSSSLRLIELGCAPGPWLYYFSANFLYKTYGLELSHKGCLKTIANLNALNSKSTVICGDILSSPLKKESFDVAMSFGLIEHFRNPGDILQIHIDLVKDGGIFIVLVPNYSFLNKCYLKMKLSKSTFFDFHNLDACGMKGLKKIIKGKGISVLFLGYCGTFYPDIYGISFTNVEKQIALNRKVTAWLKKLPEFECPLISPFVLLIGKKAPAL